MGTKFTLFGLRLAIFKLKHIAEFEPRQDAHCFCIKVASTSLDRTMRVTKTTKEMIVFPSGCFFLDFER